MRSASTQSFDASRAAALAVQRQELASPRLNPDCHSILVEHGHRTARTVAFMHGITSSPYQFKALGELFFAHGYNVWIPRMPRHGYADRLTRDPQNLTVAEFVAYATQTVDIARGLGDHLTVAGLSVSGVVAAWCAQNRSDVDLAVPIAPSFAPYGCPFPLAPALAWAGKRLPSMFLWWDLRLRARVGPACSYPRFSTHAMAESFQLGLEIFRAAETDPPACQDILVITNPRDLAVNNAATRAVIRRWRKHGNSRVREHAFGRDLGPLHDIIGPYQPNARTDYVYPILLDLIDRRA